MGTDKNIKLHIVTDIKQQNQFLSGLSLNIIMSPSTYPSEIERYYKRFFDRREDKPLEDLCVLAHSNKVFIITLTPDHKALQSGPIQSLDYVVETGGKKVGDVHGKRKLDAIKLKTGTPLCKITSADGTVYTINSPVRGKLCELNDNVIKDLTLLTRMPETNGYLAIVLHNTCSDEEYCNYLLTAEQYSNGEVISSNSVSQDTDENMVIDGTAETNDQGMDTATKTDVPTVTEEKVERLPDVNGGDEKGNATKQETQNEVTEGVDDKKVDTVVEDAKGKRKSKTKTPARVASKRSKK